MIDDYQSFSSDRRSIKSSSSIKQAIIDSDILTLRTFVANLKKNVSINRNLILSLLSSKQSESFEDTSVSVMPSKAIENLIQENKVLEAKIDKIIEERNEFQSKSLLNEQIRNEWEGMHKELEDDFKEQLEELKMQNERKDRVINEMKQINSVLMLEADLANQSKHVFEVKPNEEIINMHCKVEDIREIIENKARKIALIESKYGCLTGFIDETEKKINMIKALLANPLNRKNNLEKKEKYDFVCQKNQVEVEGLYNSSDYRQRSFTIEGVNKEQEELMKYEEAFKAKSSKLNKIIGKNLNFYYENQKILKQNQDLASKVSKMYADYYKEDMTTEIIQNYESTSCYRIKAGSLDSIVEIELNHSHFYESDSEEKSIQ